MIFGLLDFQKNKNANIIITLKYYQNILLLEIYVVQANLMVISHHNNYSKSVNHIRKDDNSLAKTSSTITIHTRENRLTFVINPIISF